MKKSLTLAVIAILTSMLLPTFTLTAAEFSVPFLKTAPVIDGRFDAGEWDFAKFNHGSGKRTVRHASDLWADGGRKIMVPGCWEAQGVGEEGKGIPYLCQDNSAKTLRHVFAGEGWYRRYVDIPASWAGMPSRSA